MVKLACFQSPSQIQLPFYVCLARFTWPHHIYNLWTASGISATKSKWLSWKPNYIRQEIAIPLPREWRFGLGINSCGL